MDRFEQIKQPSDECDYDMLMPCDTTSDTCINSNLVQVFKSEPVDNFVAVAAQSNYELKSEIDVEEPKIDNIIKNGNFKRERKDEIEDLDIDESTDADEVLEQTVEDRNYKNNRIRKLKRNSGLAYITKNGKLIKKRKSKELKYCKKRCGEKISKELREKCFREYWNLGTYSKRLSYASERIQINKKSRITNLLFPKKQRNFTCKYFVIDEDTQTNIDVCKGCYMNIYGETNGFISSIIKKNTTGLDLIDFRGQYVEPGKTVSNQQKSAIEAHIKSFPVYESYYDRKKLYLADGLNITKMYDLYQEKFLMSKVSFTKYREVFNTLNLKFIKPPLNTCSKCVRFNMKIKMEQSQAGKDDLQSQYNEHIESAEISYKTTQMDIIDLTKTVLRVDVQQCFPTPYLKCSTSFYKRKLWTFNLTITNCNDNTTHFFIWDETISGGGANEGASCIFKYLTTNSSTLTSHIIIYSETSVGQHRNSTIATMFQYLMSTNPKFNIIEHKFLDPGHTHIDCDSEHNMIEKKQKSCNAFISHPYDWAQLIRSCGRKKKFHVYEMKIEDFFDFTKLQKQYLKKTLNILWNDVRLLRYTKGNYTSLSYKTSYTDVSWKTIVTTKTSNTHFKLKQLNYVTLPISDEKKSDLLDLLEFIPLLFHNYYYELKTKTNIKEFCYIEDESENDENYI